MSESSVRGTLETLLDPSNPSSSKQTMLDWLRIHHPKTVISSKINKDEVAKIVREKQPACQSTYHSVLVFWLSDYHCFLTPCYQFSRTSIVFPNPASDSPAVPAGITEIYPTLEHLRVSSPTISRSKDKADQLVKRAASQDLEPPYPSKRIGIGRFSRTFV
jgi:hypothetical protein